MNLIMFSGIIQGHRLIIDKICNLITYLLETDLDLSDCKTGSSIIL